MRMQVSERYLQSVRCGNITFLFSRLEQFPKVFRTHVRVRINGSRGSEHPFGERLPAMLPESMSHGPAFVCIASGGRQRLVAYGMAAFACKAVLRSESEPSLPFRWSPPQEVISSSKNESLCVDERESRRQPHVKCCECTWLAT